MKLTILRFSILIALINTQSLAIQEGQLVIVVRDSVALRTKPNIATAPSKYALNCLQLKVLEVSPDGRWYKVKIGEQKGYQLRHEEKYWVRESDVVKEPSSTRVDIVLDVSVLEKGNLSNARRISHGDYIHRQEQINLAEPYYVGCTYTNTSPELSCSPPFSICAQIYEPKNYLLYDSTELKLASRYETLFDNGQITPFYRVKSKHLIKAISQRVVCAKLIMQDPGCYAETYSGTEFYTLTTTTDTVNATEYFAAVPVSTDNLFHSRLKGGVQTVYFLFVLHFTFDDNEQETVVRRIVVWWPKCA